MIGVCNLMKGIMLGVDNLLSGNVEVWVNEFCLIGFNEKGGLVVIVCVDM